MVSRKINHSETLKLQMDSEKICNYHVTFYHATSPIILCVMTQYVGGYCGMNIF